jgi:putative mRNA 3-end processing factor
MMTNPVFFRIIGTWDKESRIHCRNASQRTGAFQPSIADSASGMMNFRERSSRRTNRQAERWLNLAQCAAQGGNAPQSGYKRRMRAADLLHPTPAGLYCPAGGFHIDPVRPVPRALITHGHADHARPGHGAVLATRQTLDIMALRYGDGHAAATQAAEPGAVLTLDGVRVSFHPAGHVLGSAQIEVEAGGLRIVAAGDYKRGSDPTCADFVPVPCDVFITEATFALPVFRHPEPGAEIARLLTSLRQFPERAHLVGVYALGKAQRVIRLLRDAGFDRPIYIHGALTKLCGYYEAQGIALGQLDSATVARGRKGDFAGAVVMGPPSAFAAKWAQRFPDPLICFASGWMQVRARARQRGVELPLVISDHCDWTELTETIAELAPGEVWVTHGREEALVRWCSLQGIAARPLHLVGYEDEAAE